MIKWTDEQYKAITHEGENIVVSASAGSGKTKIMIERIIRLLVEKKCEIDQILAVTFTKLAANEMKTRVINAICAELSRCDDDTRQFLKRQLDKMGLANFSTVHSFCTNMLRTYFYVLGIDSAFGIIDDSEKADYVSQAIDDVFEQLYDEGDQDLKMLLDIFISGRTDKALREHIVTIYSKAINLADPQNYIDHMGDLYCEQGWNLIVNRVIGDLSCLLGESEKLLKSALEKTERLLGETSDERQKGVLTKYQTFFVNNLSSIAVAKRAENPIKYLAENNLKKGTKPQKSDKISQEVEQELAGYCSSMATAFKSIGSLAADYNYDYSDIDFAACEALKVINALSTVTKKFADRYAYIKQSQGKLDFNDLEHFMLELLSFEDIKNEIKSGFKYIFVDEYQDTNAIQEAIFSRLESDNMFIVGDIKQSIYAFRGCDPTLFAKKINSCANGYGAHISLDDNFRSSSKIIEFVNNVFSAVMTEQNAKYDYIEHPMKYGELYADFVGSAVVHVFEKTKREKGNFEGVYSVKKHLSQMKDEVDFGEEQIVAQIVEEEYGKPFYDLSAKDDEPKIRPVDFKDICIITRSKEKTADKILNELVKRSIPVVNASDKKIVDYPEIVQMKDIVTFICSPYSDIALCSALKSWAGGFDDCQLAQIRKKYHDGTFVEACNAYLTQEKDELALKLKEFFDYFENLRIYAQFETAQNTLSKLLRDRNGEITLLGSNFGSVKVQRVKLFINSAKDGSIYDFYRNINNVLKNLTFGQSGGENAVQIMNAHKTKGLEFPIVIACELNNYGGGNPPVFELNNEYGLGVKSYDRINRKKSDNVFYKFIKRENNKLELTEEMRLFYVTLTRAKARLHVVSSKELSLSHDFIKVVSAKSNVDLLAQTDGVCVREDFKLVPLCVDKRDVLISQGDEKIMKEINEFLDFSYPYVYEQTLNLKRSVTAVVKNQNESLQENVEPPFEYRPIFDESDTGGASGKTSIEIGIAYHKFLQYADFSVSAELQLKKLLEDEIFTESEAALLDVEKLQKILDIDRIKDLSEYKLFREQPFILNVPSQLIDPTSQSQETVLVQGVIDLLAVKGNEAVIFDYKYSHRPQETLKKAYSKQLELYCYAVEKIQGLKVVQTAIINLNSAQYIPVENK